MIPPPTRITPSRAAASSWGRLVNRACCTVPPPVESSRGTVLDRQSCPSRFSANDRPSPVNGSRRADSREMLGFVGGNRGKRRRAPANPKRSNHLLQETIMTKAQTALAAAALGCAVGWFANGQIASGQGGTQKPTPVQGQLSHISFAVADVEKTAKAFADVFGVDMQKPQDYRDIPWGPRFPGKKMNTRRIG